MKRTKNIQIIKRELERLNQRIDLKIIHGQPYAAESRVHRMLLDRMRRFHRQSFLRSFLERLFPKRLSFF